MATVERRWDRVAVGSIAGGTVLRAVFGLWLHPPLNYAYSDMRGYITRAVRLAAGAKLNRFDTFFPPGTHIVLALPLRVFGTGRAGLWAASVVWFLISSSVPLLAWRFARRLMPPKAAAITALLTAFWPLYVIYGGFFLSEIPATAALLLTLWLAFRVHESDGNKRIGFAITAGLAAGSALAIRPQLVLNLAIAAWTMLGGRRSPRVALAAGAGLLLPVAAVLVLNAHAAGRFVGLSENGGLNFFQGHCPVNTVRMEKRGVGGLVFASPVVVQQNTGHDYYFADRAEWDQPFFFHLGIDCIRADGVGHLRVVAHNVADLGITSVPWPPSEEPLLRHFARPANLAYSWAIAAIVVFAAALAREKRGRSASRPGLLIAHLVCVLPTAIVFYGDPRFRVPYDVFGLGLSAILLTTYLPRRHAEPSESA